jgi:hypothetical protein
MIRCQREFFTLPSRQSADHFLHAAAEAWEAKRAFVRAVAMRTAPQDCGRQARRIRDRRELKVDHPARSDADVVA